MSAGLVNVKAEETAVVPQTVDATEAVETVEAGDYTYDDYLNDCGDVKIPTTKSSVDVSSFSMTNGTASFADGIVTWVDGKGELAFNFNVEEDGFYNFIVTWQPGNSGIDPEFGFKVDGEYVFDELKESVLDRDWKNASEEPRKDVNDNEYAPEQIEIEGMRHTYIKDPSGIADGPYMFKLSAGAHTVSFVEIQQKILISGIKVVPVEDIKSYKDVSASYKVADLDADIITIQGESATIKSGNSIIPKSNNSDAGMAPCDAYKTKINYIGSTAWQMPGDMITWNFTVEKAGYYSINTRYKQSDLMNASSLRWLKIDGKTPFTEAKQMEFPYTTKWEYLSLTDKNDELCYIWLDEGEHTVSMEITLADQADFFKRLSEFTKILGDEYIKIVMITSDTPDVNRDYDLYKHIPNFNKTLKYCRNGLNDLSKDMQKAAGGNTTQVTASIDNMARVLNNMIEDYNDAHQYISNYYTNYTAISSWLYDMIKLPLSIDEIQFVPAGKEHNDNTPGFFKQTGFDIIRLASSFVNDYSITDNNSNNDRRVRIWVNWGQDQVSVMNSLIQSTFTPNTGIEVQLELVACSLINGLLAGNFPDLCLQTARTAPVNMGVRGALADLRQFPDCDEVLERFHPGSEVPYKYNDKLYGLPDSQSFLLMFYRTDILENIGVEVPNTWDELKQAATIIQRNNMNVYIPYTQMLGAGAADGGIGNVHILPSLMLQNGLSFYNDELNATNLDNKPTIKVFEEWTEFYSDYNILKEAEFYNRMRSGTMPLGISTYATYLSLYTLAPEIKGRWGIALVPGTPDENGNIKRTIAGGGTACSIVEKSEHKEEAWEFLKWWTSADTQARYSNNVESILTTVARVATSNKEAFQALAWDSDHLKILMEQWEQVVELPEVPGGYYLARSIDQTYWAILNNTSSAKDAVVKWSQIADEEIARKIEEYK